MLASQRPSPLLQEKHRRTDKLEFSKHNLTPTENSPVQLGGQAICPSQIIREA